MDNVFKSNDVFLAHCLTQNGGAGNAFSKDRNLYQRLSDTINNKPEISCSTIKQGDTLEYLKITNFFGPVGLILTNTNITFASSVDSGTSVLINGKRNYILTHDTYPTEVNIKNAIVNRPNKWYNELCSDSYNIFGLFICFDDLNFLKQNILSESNFYQNTQHFNLPYFNLSKGNLYRSNYDNLNGWFVVEKQIPISEIYN